MLTDIVTLTVMWHKLVPMEVQTYSTLSFVYHLVELVISYSWYVFIYKVLWLRGIRWILEIKHWMSSKLHSLWLQKYDYMKMFPYGSIDLINLGTPEDREQVLPGYDQTLMYRHQTWIMAMTVFTHSTVFISVRYI